MKDVISKTRTVQLVNNAATVNNEGQSATAVDLGTAREGTLIIQMNWTSDLGVSELGVYTEADSTITEIAGSLATITQDTVNSTSTLVQTTDNILDSIIVDGIWIFHVANLKRYMTIFWDADDTNAVWSACFIAHDLEQAPYSTATSAYS